MTELHGISRTFNNQTMFSLSVVLNLNCELTSKVVTSLFNMSSLNRIHSDINDWDSGSISFISSHDDGAHDLSHVKFFIKSNALLMRSSLKGILWITYIQPEANDICRLVLNFDKLNAVAIIVFNPDGKVILILCSLYYWQTITNNEVCLSFLIRNLFTQFCYSQSGSDKSTYGCRPAAEGAYPTAEAKPAAFTYFACIDTYDSKIEEPKGYKHSHARGTDNSYKNTFFTTKHYYAPANDVGLVSTIINDLARAAA